MKRMHWLIGALLLPLGLVWLATFAIAKPPPSRPSPASKPATLYNLYGQAVDNRVRLRWEVEPWPADLDAFNIYRRPIDASDKPTGPWEKRTATPVIPGLDKAKNLENIEPDAAERQRLAPISANLAELWPKEVHVPGFKAMARSKGTAYLFEAYRSSKLDFDSALAFGLGCCDRSFSAAHDHFQYALVAAKPGGDATDPAAIVPLAVWNTIVFTSNDPRLHVETLEAKAVPTGIWISWNWPPDKAQAYSISEFQVYRAEAGSDNFTALFKAPVGPSSAAADQGKSVCLDSTANPKAKYRYALAPVDMLSRELDTRTIVSYPAP